MVLPEYGSFQLPETTLQPFEDLNPTVGTPQSTLHDERSGNPCLHQSSGGSSCVRIWGSLQNLRRLLLSALKTVLSAVRALLVIFPIPVFSLTGIKIQITGNSFLRDDFAILIAQSSHHNAV